MARRFTRTRLVNMPGVVGQPISSPSGAKGGSPVQRIARRRRSAGTRAELRLAEILRELAAVDRRVEFQREWAFGGKYIADFFFHEVRLAIEVDGPSHNSVSQKRKDARKAEVLEELEVTLVRLKNREVFGNRAALLQKLRRGWIAAKRKERGLVDT